MKYLIANLNSHKILTKINNKTLSLKKTLIAVNNVYFYNSRLNLKNQKGNGIQCFPDDFFPFDINESYSYSDENSIFAVSKNDIKKTSDNSEFFSVIPVIELLKRKLNIVDDGLYFIFWAEYIYCIYINSGKILYYLDEYAENAEIFISGCIGDIKKIFNFTNPSKLFFDIEKSNFDKSKQKFDYDVKQYTIDIYNEIIKFKPEIILKNRAAKKKFPDTVKIAKYITSAVLVLTIINFILLFLLKEKNIEISKFNEAVKKYNQLSSESSAIENQINQLYLDFSNNKSFALFFNSVFDNSDKLSIHDLKTSVSNNSLNNEAYNELKNDMTSSSVNNIVKLNFFV
ncbi:hypothetical protein KA977_14565, partial [Candidatus Dependentiae bacterium]|nr:hypothetical protein [Candidatus Dependentiae bacterium]